MHLVAQPDNANCEVIVQHNKGPLIINYIHYMLAVKNTALHNPAYKRMLSNSTQKKTPQLQQLNSRGFIHILPTYVHTYLPYLMMHLLEYLIAPPPVTFHGQRKLVSEHQMVFLVLELPAANVLDVCKQTSLV